MSAKKQWKITIEDREYSLLPEWLKDKAIVYYNDYNDYKDEPGFKDRYNAYRKAAEELDIFKFELRNGKTR